MSSNKQTETRPIGRVLVANRGEIAVRVIRACREMGIATVAVCSDADRSALHVEMADQFEVLGAAEPAASYLRAEAIIEAAVRTGADAIHPGYGFLAENAEFSRAVSEAGLIFIGPSPEVITSMGEKTAARAIMEKAGVPVVPGALLPQPDGDGPWPEAEVLAAGREVGYPLLVKAAFGGGGKGMRLVEDEGDLLASCQAAAREAAKAFGNGTVYLEHYLTRPRHIEFQIFGDSHGNQVHMFERECSIQRRHQKIIEECPSAVMTPELRERMGQAAVAAARAVDYEGAGTVEFLLDEDGSFYFLEMNTRLQVEHPVTELATGLDLVRAQIMVAAGHPLPWRQEDISLQGHAIECRIYAEDPAHGFMPSLGVLGVVREPSGPGVRVDSGVRQGDEVSMYYDPMIAKLSVHGPDRAAATERAVRALKDYAVLGVTTNTEYLLAILAEPAFATGEIHTGFLAEHLDGWEPDTADGELALAVAAVADHLQGAAGHGAPAHGTAAVTDQGGNDPWRTVGRFRLRGLD